MRTSFLALVVASATIANFLDVVNADKVFDIKATTKLLREGILKSNGKDKLASLSEEEERGAKEAVSKVTSLLGLSKNSAKLPQAKLEKLKTVARSDSDQVSEIVGYVGTSIGVAILAFLVFVLGHRPSMAVGNPTAN